MEQENIEIEDVKIFLDESNRSVQISNLILEDNNVFTFLSNIPEAAREEASKKAFIIGCIGLRNMIMADNMDFVQKEFNELIKKIQSENMDVRERLLELFNIDDSQKPLGRFKSLFEDYFDIQNGRVSQILDPFKEDTHLYKLRNEIIQKLDQLKAEILKEIVTESTFDNIASMTTLKGGVFEEDIMHEVDTICRPYEDKTKYVGNITGKNGKTGDIIIDLDGNEKRRIVIECKDSGSYSKKQTVEEIENAIYNRDAKYGIFLFKKLGQIPREFQPLKIGCNFLICSSENNILYFAYKIARLIIEREDEVEQIDIPLEKIESELDIIHKKMEVFNEIYKNVNNIKRASENIEKQASAVEKDIENSLGRIISLIGKS